MKNLKQVVFVIAITFTGMIWGDTIDPKREKTATIVTTKVSDLLQNPNFEINEDIKAMVSFTVNKKNQIVVLSVDTKNPLVERYIKSRLNYQKLSYSVLNRTRIFEIPVRMTSK